MASVKIGRHGNSLSLRLPAFVAQSMKLKVGDYASPRYLDDGSLRGGAVNERRIIPADGVGQFPLLPATRIGMRGSGHRRLASREHMA